MTAARFRGLAQFLATLVLTVGPACFLIVDYEWVIVLRGSGIRADVLGRIWLLTHWFFTAAAVASAIALSFRQAATSVKVTGCVGALVASASVLIQRLMAPLRDRLSTDPRAHERIARAR